MSMDTTLSESGRVDDIQSPPQGELRGQTKRVKITEDIRKYAAGHGIAEEQSLESGMEEKRKEFLEKRAKLYAKT